jgi:hypothetical protein
MKNIPLHGLLPKDRHKQTKANAKKLGLNTIPDVVYTLTKLGAKVTSGMGYPDAFEVITGKVSILGEKEHTWIAVETRFDWFKTSPILKVKKLKTCFKFETENSFYKLSKPKIKK